MIIYAVFKAQSKCNFRFQSLFALLINGTRSGMSSGSMQGAASIKNVDAVRWDSRRAQVTNEIELGLPGGRLLNARPVHHHDATSIGNRT